MFFYTWDYINCNTIDIAAHTQDEKIDLRNLGCGRIKENNHSINAV